MPPETPYGFLPDHPRWLRTLVLSHALGPRRGEHLQGARRLGGAVLGGDGPPGRHPGPTRGPQRRAVPVPPAPERPTPEGAEAPAAAASDPPADQG